MGKFLFPSSDVMKAGQMEQPVWALTCMRGRKGQKKHLLVAV